MNRTAQRLILAAGFAAAALTLTTAPAHADGGDLALAPIVDPDPDPKPEIQPQPQPDPQPKPQFGGPDTLTAPPKCTHGCGGGTEPGPSEEPADEPAGDPANDPANDPAGHADLDQGCFSGCDLPSTESVSMPTEVFTPPRTDAELDQVLDQVLDSDPASRAEQGAPVWLWLAVGSLLIAAVAAFRAAYRIQRQQ